MHHEEKKLTQKNPKKYHFVGMYFLKTNPANDEKKNNDNLLWKVFFPLLSMQVLPNTRVASKK